MQVEKHHFLLAVIEQFLSTIYACRSKFSQIHCMYIQSRTHLIFRLFHRNSRHFEFSDYFGSYVNYYKSKTFLMPIGLLQEFVLCRCKKIFLNQIVAILELAAKYFYLKTNKQRWKHTRHSEYIQIKVFNHACCQLLTKKFRGVPIEAEI